MNVTTHSVSHPPQASLEGHHCHRFEPKNRLQQVMCCCHKRHCSASSPELCTSKALGFLAKTSAHGTALGSTQDDQVRIILSKSYQLKIRANADHSLNTHQAKEFFGSHLAWWLKCQETPASLTEVPGFSTRVWLSFPASCYRGPPSGSGDGSVTKRPSPAQTQPKQPFGE